MVVKKTLAASITKQSTCRAGGNHHRTYVFEPGNRTKYIVRTSVLSPSECEILNAPADAVLVTVGIGGTYTSYPFSMAGGYISYAYLRAKLGLGIVDTKALAPMLGHLLNCVVGA